MKKTATFPALVLTALAAGAACNGGGGANNGAGGAFDREIQKPIFDALCVDCHYPGAATDYDLKNPFDPQKGIVRRANSWPESKEKLIVDPGNVANSFLIKKVEAPMLDDHIDGNPMPYLLPRLTQAELDAVQKWITDGAKNDATFTSTVAPIFGTEVTLRSQAGRCTYCHYNDAPSGMSVLNVFDPVQGMVGRNSRYGGKIVAPGDPAGSALMKKLSGDTLGAQMPLHRPRLTPPQIETLRKWITAGAPKD